MVAKKSRCTLPPMTTRHLLMVLGILVVALLAGILTVTVLLMSSTRQLAASQARLAHDLAQGFSAQGRTAQAQPPPEQQPAGGAASSVVAGESQAGQAGDGGGGPGVAVQLGTAGLFDSAATAAAVGGATAAAEAAEAAEADGTRDATGGNAPTSDNAQNNCPPGWGGAACTRCQTADGWPGTCASLLPTGFDPWVATTCVSGSFDFSNTTLYKVFSCTVDEAMSSVFGSMESYCSAVPAPPMLPAYKALALQLNLSTFDISGIVNGTAATAAISLDHNSTAAANTNSAGGNDSVAANATAGRGGGTGSGGEPPPPPVVVSSPYCLLALRGGPYLGNSSLACVGLGCEFVQDTQSHRCTGGLRCGCPALGDPGTSTAASASAAAGAGAPAGLDHCAERARLFALGLDASFVMQCSAAGGFGVSTGKCNLSIAGVGFTCP